MSTPDGASGVYYSCQAISGQMFADLPDFHFDNGTRGTINVKWPDAIEAMNGAKNILRYKNAPTKNIAGIAFEGGFPGWNGRRKTYLFWIPIRDNLS